MNCKGERTLVMRIDEWIRFEDSLSFITSTASPGDGLLPIYHTRESYIESMFESLILVPSRSVVDELKVSSFSFNPKDYRRRLTKLTSYHFLGRSFRTAAALTCKSHTNYTDRFGKLAAERCDTSNCFESTCFITLRADILTAYCDHHRLVPIWVFDSFRYSERLPDDLGLTVGRRDVRQTAFCYFQLVSAPKTSWNRPRMRTRSRIGGKRLFFQ